MADEERKKKKPCRRKTRSKKTKAACKAARTRARKHAARVAAGKKGARARWRKKTVRTKARRSSTKRGKRKGTKRASPRRSTRRTTRRRGHRKSPKRVKAAKKAARTRARRNRERKEGVYGQGEYGPSRETRRRRRRRRKNPVAAAPRRRRRRRNPVAVAETPRRRRRRRKGTHHSRRRRSIKAARTRRRRYGKGRYFGAAREARRHKHSHRRRNPLSGAMEMLAGLLGVSGGFVGAGFVDRMLATHEYANGQDTPAQGQIYNSEAIALPIWSSWQRLAGAAASIVVPMGVSSWVKSSFWKSLWQLATFGAVARTVGKAGEDGIAMLAELNPTSPNLFLLRLYAPENAASFKLNASNSAALPAVTMATFAGLPFSPRRGLGSLSVGQTIPTGIGFDQYAGWTVAAMNANGSCPAGGVVLGEGACALPPPAPPPGPPVQNILPPAVTATVPQSPVPVSPPPAPPPFSSPGGPLAPPGQAIPQGYQYNPLFACPDDCAAN